MIACRPSPDVRLVSVFINLWFLRGRASVPRHGRSTNKAKAGEAGSCAHRPDKRDNQLTTPRPVQASPASNDLLGVTVPTGSD